MFLQTHHAFGSRFLPQARDITVYLPSSYLMDETRRWPVLYLHDGQNLFDGAEAFIPGQSWRVHETAEGLAQSGHSTPLIIVGVHNTGPARLNEYTPTVYKGRGGQAKIYGRFLVEELKPFIDATYRTLPQREATGLGGSSLGGLVTLHLGLQWPEIFSRLAVMSPSVWWDRGYILRQVAALSWQPPLRIWLDIGTNEGFHARRQARQLRDVLKQRGWRPRADLQYHEARHGRHDETSWGQRFDQVLRFLYPSGPEHQAVA